MDNHAEVKTTGAAQVELPHDFVVAAYQQILVQQGQEAQKGSSIAKESLLDSVISLKDSSLKKEVLDGLQSQNFAKINRATDGTPTELVFDEPIKGYGNTTVKVDLLNQKVNQKDAKTLAAEANRERKEFIDGLVNAPNRPLPEGEKKPLDEKSRQLLKSLENALVDGDLASIRTLFQKQPNNSALWERLTKEVGDNDFGSTWLKYGKGADGKPYLAVGGDTEKYEEISDSVIIPASGAPYASRFGDKGEVDTNVKIARDTKSVIDAQTPARKQTIETKVYDYKCDFDAHEKQKAASVPLKTIVQKYNSYTRHLCGADSVD